MSPFGTAILAGAEVSMGHTGSAVAGDDLAINAFGLPVTLLIDREGRELGRVIGAAEWDGSGMLSLIAGYLEARDRDRRIDTK